MRPTTPRRCRMLTPEQHEEQARAAARKRLRPSGYQRAAQKSAHNRSHVKKGAFHDDCIWCWHGGSRSPVRMPNMAERATALRKIVEKLRAGITINTPPVVVEQQGPR